MHSVHREIILALACDFRMTVAGVEFWMPEVDLGVPQESA